MARLARFSITMDDELLARFDELVRRRGAGVNRSEAVRDLVRDALVEAAWEGSEEEIVGTVTMVFDHGVGDLSDRLDALQHAHHDKIVSAMHVHLDAHNCLEVLVVRGSGDDVRYIADTLLGTKGVKHGKLVMTTGGAEL
ncbi:MAG: nickel-responsive transcriptional regulator NikR [Coriobacteriia bacterium]|nr:nickel-responsive transcriptional regulator NikR [Coriobacteriia bacterium]